MIDEEAVEVRSPNLPVRDSVYDTLTAAINDAQKILSVAATERTRAINAYEDATYQLSLLKAAEAVMSGRDQVQKKGFDINNPLNFPVDRR